MTIIRKSRTDIEVVCTMNSKSRVEDIVNKEDTSAVVEIERVFKITTGTTINQTIDVFSSLPDSDETKSGDIKVNIIKYSHYFLEVNGANYNLFATGSIIVL